MKKFGTCNSIFNGDQGYELMTIETDISSGLYFFKIIGLADRMVQESRFRILSGLRNSEFGVPQRRNEKVTVSLLPAHVKKASMYSDLAIAAAYLIASGQIPDFENPTMLIGQVGLDGAITCDDELSHIIRIGIQHDIRHYIFPTSCKIHDESNQDMYIAYADSLKDMDGIEFQHIQSLHSHSTYSIEKNTAENSDDIDHEKIFKIDTLEGIDHHKRALQIAITGMHPILFGGVPGTGKSALARCTIELMKNLSHEQASEVHAIYTNAGIPRQDFYTPPMRAPHHHMTRIGMIGGVQNRHFGEISLAHHGVLILDELCEFDRATIESLREVFDQRGAHIRKGSKQIFILFEGLIIATTNLCPCGSIDVSADNTAAKSKSCRCEQIRIRQYRGKLSDPMLDRFHIKTVFNRSIAGTNAAGSELSGEEIARRIRDAQNIQDARNGPAGSLPNAYLTVSEITAFGISAEASIVMDDLEKELSLPKRLITNTLRVARTIADLESSREIEKPHILEAFQYVKTNPFG
jgi:magnesium chelatase family protein